MLQILEMLTLILNDNNRQSFELKSFGDVYSIEVNVSYIELSIIRMIIKYMDSKHYNWDMQIHTGCAIDIEKDMLIHDPVHSLISISEIL